MTIRVWIAPKDTDGSERLFVRINNDPTTQRTLVKNRPVALTMKAGDTLDLSNPSTWVAIVINAASLGVYAGFAIPGQNRLWTNA